MTESWTERRRTAWSTLPMVDSSDLDAFCELTLDEVYRYALRLTGGDRTRTADLTQETYAALLRHVARHPGQPVGLPWLITCCRHRHLDALRRRRRREHHQRRGWEPSTTEPVTQHDDVIMALARLGPEERAALVLRHVDGLPIADVAALLGKSLAATDSILRRGRERLRGHLTATNEELERS